MDRVTGSEGGGPTVDDLGRNPADAGLAPGAKLGRYQLLGRIGGGAMGVVWRARDPKLDRDIAIKLVHPSLARIPDAAARLMREARALAKVSHSAVVAVHDAGHEDDHLYLAMELIEGTTLGAMIRRRRPAELRDWRRTLALVTEAGRGLAAAHAAGVLHRDFKPDNVLVSSAGRVAVADFGLAEIAVGASASTPKRPSTAELGDSWQVESVDSLTLTGAVVGTPAYMSPEQLRSGVVDARSDQFGFCVTAYEALYGHRPFEIHPGPDQPPALALLAEVELGNIKPPPRDARVPRWVRDVIVRGLAADPGLRWPDMRSLLAAMQPPRRRWLWGVGGLAAAAAIAAAVWALIPDRPRVLAPRRLFPMPMSQRIESSADGTRIVYADDDRVYVREVGGTAPPRELSLGGLIDHVEFDGPDTVLASVSDDRGLMLRRWYVTSGVSEDVAVLTGGWSRWHGDTARGRICSRYKGDTAEIAVVGAASIDVFATTKLRFSAVEVAPGGHKLAYFLDDGFSGRLAVYDVDRQRTITTPTIVEPTGLTWHGDGELIYSTGMSEHPTMWRARVGADAIGAPVKLWEKDTGWFGYLAVAGRSIQFVDTATTFMARWVDREAPAASRELDPATVAAGLGWDDFGRPLGWQRVSGRIIAFDVSDARIESEPTPAVLDGDIANATRAGDVVIVTLRRRGAREVVAVSLADGRRLWSRAPGDGLLVRCAGDTRAPCFLARSANGIARIDQIDPATGALGASLPSPDDVADLAVAADGSELLVADGGAGISRIALGGTAPALVPYTRTSLATIRGLAYDPRGGVLATGTRRIQVYQLIQAIPGPDPTAHAVEEHVVAQSSNDLLSVPRPSPSGDQVLVLTRRYLPALYLLPHAL
jgi:hypothetical protein